VLVSFATFVFFTLSLCATAASVVVLSLLAQLRHGLKVIPAVIPLVLTLALGAVGVLDLIIRVASDNRGGTWSETSLILFAVAIPTTGAIAALVHWAPKLVGGTVAAPVATLAGLATFGGWTLFTASGVFLGTNGAADFAHIWDKSDGNGGLALLGAVGIGIAAFGVVVLALGYAGARANSGAANPYGSGVTLEWAAASPPPLNNFESVPDVASATPLVSTGASS
jgi:hypothetical protein